MKWGMASLFDLSEQSANKIHSALKECTTLRDGNAQTTANNQRRRQRIIDALFRPLRGIQTNLPSNLTFPLELNQGAIAAHDKQTSMLFQKIASAICRNNITNFHFIAHGKPFHHWEKFGKYTASWDYRNYHFKAYTRVSRRGTRSLDYFINVIDKEQLHNDSDDSDELTDEEVSERSETDLPPRPDGSRHGTMNSVYSILSNMHDRINILESTFQSTALTTASPPRLG